ncbi:MAG: hypothetical protein B7Z35_06490 [Hydrogenophilales bacterium 12-61-10]|nr:MAG: hypothetical protein B7Z35_06490 [Hydrogenophilales bacterium 12-61-10]
MRKHSFLFSNLLILALSIGGGYGHMSGQGMSNPTAASADEPGQVKQKRSLTKQKQPKHQKESRTQTEAQTAVQNRNKTQEQPNTRTQINPRGQSDEPLQLQKTNP